MGSTGENTHIEPRLDIGSEAGGPYLGQASDNRALDRQKQCMRKHRVDPGETD